MRLEIKDLHVHYDKIEAIKGISVVVNEGEIVTLIALMALEKQQHLKLFQGFEKYLAVQLCLMVRTYLRYRHMKE